MIYVDDTPDVRSAKEKDYEARKSSIAVENIEKAIGLDEQTIESLIDDVKSVSRRQEVRYHGAILNDKKEEESAVDDKKAEAEDRLLKDEELEGKAIETVNQINRLEKVLTVVEAAKFDAQRRANQRLQTAEIWKSRMYGKAKKRDARNNRKIVKKSIDKASKVIRNILKKEKARKRSVEKNFGLHGEVRSSQNGGKTEVDASRMKRSPLYEVNKRNPLRAKFQRIRNLAQEIVMNIPETK